MSNDAKPVIGEIFLQRAYRVPEGPVHQRIAWAQADVRGNAWCVIVGFTQGEGGVDEVQYMTRNSNPSSPMHVSIKAFSANWERP
jgi:hypothetical protein